NEVGPSHPLRLTIAQIEAQGSNVEHLSLSPLGRDDTGRFLGDALHTAPEQIAELADLVFARTGGNPFFLRAFVTALNADGLLQPPPSGWRFDVDAIRQRGVTDNVVVLLSSRIERLPRPTQDLLRLAACVGGRFDLGTLAKVAARSVEEAGHALW